MPLWPRRQKTTTTPEADKAPAPKLFSDALFDAVLKSDTSEARRLFDQAFWEKADLKPDGYHLLEAVLRNNREMVKLLTTHGAGWTAEETKLARVIAGPKRWRNIEGILRQAGMRTNFEPRDLRDTDPLTAIAWARRTLEAAERLHLPEASVTRQHLENLTSTSIARFFCRGDAPAALRLLRTRITASGDGSAAQPLDVAREFAEIIRLNGFKAKEALRFLDTLTAEGLHVKPLGLGDLTLQFAPGLVPELQRRGLLDETAPGQRLAVLRHWTLLQDEVDTGKAVVKLGEAFVRARGNALNEDAKILFRKERQATAAEAAAFVSLHEMRVKQAPLALANVDQALLELGFFDSPAFTAAHLSRLAAQSPSEGLTGSFNRLAAARRISEEGLASFLTAAKFGEIEAAHRARAWKADAGETVLIVDYLAKQVKKDTVPQEISAALDALRTGGADFTAVDPNRYLGKTAPGFAKALLDADAVPAAAFNFDALAKRSGDELRLVTPPEHTDFRSQEFMCQLLLEKIAPDRFISLRNQPGISYQQQFLREWASNPVLKRITALSAPQNEALKKRKFAK